MQADGDKKIDLIKSRIFTIQKSSLKPASRLLTLEERTINMRMKALFKFSKIFSQCIKYVNSNDRLEVGTISNSHYNCKSFVITSVINQIVDIQLRTIPSGNTTSVAVNRRKAFEYFD